MPLMDEDILRDLMHHYTAGVYPDASVAAAVAARQRRREIRRRAGSAVAAGAALSVAAGVIAFVPGHAGEPAGGAGPAGAKPGGTAITLTASQRVLYQLSAAAARQQAAQGRYVTLYEKEDGNLDVNVIDTQTGDDYGYQKGFNGAPSGVGKVDKHYSPTAAEFAAMPLDAAALRDLLIARYKAQEAAMKAQQAAFHAKIATLVPPAKKRPAISPARYQPAVKPKLPPPNDNDMVFSQAMSLLWNPATPPALRAALFKVLAGMPAVQVDSSAHDMQGRPAVKLSWTDSDGLKYTVYEDPANGTVLEQTYDWPQADPSDPVGYDLMQRVTWTNTIPPDPYTS
jgi:hypothetical protein